MINMTEREREREREKERRVIWVVGTLYRKNISNVDNIFTVQFINFKTL